MNSNQDASAAVRKTHATSATKAHGSRNRGSIAGVHERKTQGSMTDQALQGPKNGPQRRKTDLDEKFLM